MKGRLLENQLDSNDKSAQITLTQCLQDLLSLPQNNLLVIKLKNVFNESDLLPYPDNTTSYTSLLKVLEILMYFNEHNKVIEALPEEEAVKTVLLAVKDKMISVLTVEAQGKTYPEKIIEYDYNIVLINYSDHALSEHEVNLEEVRDWYNQYKQCPILLKCSDKILCYGMVEKKENDNIKLVEKITELEASKFISLHFSQDKNIPFYVDKRYIADEIQREIESKHAHEVYVDYIYNRFVHSLVRGHRKIRLSDNIAEMLLLGFLRIIDSLSSIDKNTKPVQHILQLIRNCRHQWLKKLDNHLGLHIRESKDGTIYESTNDNKTWIGLAKILRYVYTNSEIKNSFIGQHFSNYLCTLRKDNVLYLKKNSLSLITEEDQKRQKDAIKGVIRNTEGTYSLNEFQIIPDKKTTPQTLDTQKMKDLILAIIASLHDIFYGESVSLPQAKYVVDANSKKSCVMRFPKFKSEFNLTALWKSQTLAHEINFSEEQNRYLLTAMVGCHLFLSFSETQESLLQQIQSGTIPLSSCLFSCEVQSKKLGPKITIKQIYYVNYAGKMELLEAQTSMEVIKTDLAKKMENSEWLKNKLLSSQKAPCLVNVTNKKEDDKDLFTSIGSILSYHQMISLSVMMTMPAISRFLPGLRKNKLYRHLLYADAAAITLYTTDYYKILQPVLQNFGIIPKSIYEPDPETGVVIDYVNKYVKKLGKGFESNPIAFAKFMSDMVIYSQCMSHGIATIIQTNQKIVLNSIKEEFDHTNCNLYLVNNTEAIEKCKNANKGHGIILYYQENKKKIIIHHCVDNQLTKKIMNIDLAVTVDDAQFLSHFCKKNNSIADCYAKLLSLSLITRKDNLVVPNKAQEKLVNKFIHYAMWYCENNTFDRKLFRSDLESFYINLIQPNLIKRIHSDGLFISSANKFCSASLGAIGSFISWKGWRVFTVLYVPKSFIALIMDISNVRDEVEAGYSPNTRIVYISVKIDSSLRNIVYIGILTDYDFNINDPKWKNLIDAQLKSELYTSMEFIKLDVHEKNKKTHELFADYLNISKPIPEIEKIKPYFSTSKVLPQIQLSCIQGTSLEILSDFNHEKSISKIKKYAKECQLINTYVLLPIKSDLSSTVKAKGPAICGFKFYYVADLKNILEIIIPSNTRSGFIKICDDLNDVFSLSKKDKKILAKDCLKNESISYLHTLVLERNDPRLPLIMGIGQNGKKEKRKSAFMAYTNRTKTSIINSTISKPAPFFLKTNARYSQVVNNLNNQNEEKLRILTQHLVETCQTHEELKQYEREERLIKNEDATHSMRESNLSSARVNYINKEQLIHTIKQFIKIASEDPKEHEIFSKNCIDHVNLMRQFNMLLPNDDKGSLFSIVLEHLQKFSKIFTITSKKEIFDHLRNEVDIAFLFYIFITVSEIYPLEGLKLIKAIPEIKWIQDGMTFEEIKEWLAPYKIKLSEPVSLQEKMSINYSILTNIVNLYKSYLNDHTNHLDSEDLKRVKEIIDMFTTCPFSPLNKGVLTAKYAEINASLDRLNEGKKFLLNIYETDLARLLGFCMQLLDPIVPFDQSAESTAMIYRVGKKTQSKITNFKIGSNKFTSPQNTKPTFHLELSNLTLSSPNLSDSSPSSEPMMPSLPKPPKQVVTLKHHGFFADNQTHAAEKNPAEFLMNAILNGDIQAINQILNQAAKLNNLPQILRSQNNEGQSPLHLAVLKLHAELKSEMEIQETLEGEILVRLLMAHAEADIAITGLQHTNSQGGSPLKLAMQDETEQLANFLITQNQLALQEAAKKKVLATNFVK